MVRYRGDGDREDPSPGGDAGVSALPQAGSEVRVRQADPAPCRLMPEIGGVWYSREAYEHMRQLHQLREQGEDVEHEAYIVHLFHEQFPGVTMHDGDEIPQTRRGRFQSV